MAKTAKPRMKGQDVDSYALFAEYFRLRPDVGFGKMLLDVALHARDPFKPSRTASPSVCENRQCRSCGIS